MATKRKTEPEAPAPEAPPVETSLSRYFGFAIVKIPVQGYGLDAEEAEKNAMLSLRMVLPAGAVVTESVLGAPPSPTGP